MSISKRLNRLSFSGALRLVVGSAAGLCLLLLALTWLQGPRVRSAAIDTDKVTLAANQRLQLRLNQSIGSVDKKQVTITPSASFAVTSGGNSVIMQFSQPLRHAVNYTVRIKTADGGRTFAYSFRTAPADIFYASNTGDNGTIFRKSLAGGDAKQIYSGRKISDFVVAGNTLVVSTLTSNGSNTLTYQDLTDPVARQSRVALPQDGIILSLRAAPDGRSFGFRFTSTNPQSGVTGNIGLFTISNSSLYWVSGLDKQLIQALDWQYAPDGSTILAQTYDLSTFIFTRSKPPIPLGQFAGISSFSADGSTIVASNVQGGISKLDLKTMQVLPLHVPAGASYLVDAEALHTAPGFLLQADLSKQGSSGQQLVLDRQGRQTSLYAIDNQSEYIRSARLSPNDQYVVVEKNSDVGDVFAYDIIDTASHQVVSRLDAYKVRWQQ